MILKRPPGRPAVVAELLRRAGPRRTLAAVGLVALVTGSTLWGLYEGMYLYRVKVAASLSDLLNDVVATRLAIVPNWVDAWWRSDAKEIVLDIKHQDFQKLAYQRELALRTGVVTSGSQDFVPVRIREGDQSVKAKVRLKGDWADHVSGEKWSLRVKLPAGETLLGMKEFSLQPPATRRFIYEWIFHQALAREDLIPLRYDFVDVTINGKDHGVYALEEFFDKRLIEYRQRREGPILKFDESLHWDDIVATGRRGGTSPTGQRIFRVAPVDGFGVASLQKDPKQWKMWLEAATLLESFRAGEIPVAQAFDSKKLARYFALIDLLGAEHATNWINLRFYYDPIASRLEPVGFDGNAGAILHNVTGASENLAAGDWGVVRDFFADPAFVADYVAELERVSEPAYLDALLADLGPGLERNLRILHKELPWQRFDPGIFRRNQQLIRDVLAPGKALHAYLDRSAPDRIQLELANLTQLPIEVVAAHSGRTSLVPARETRLASTPPKQRVDWVDLAFDVRGGATWSEALADGLEVEYRLLGSSQLRREKVFARPRRSGDPGQDVPRQPGNVSSFAFLDVDAGARVISVRPGAWTVDRDLVVPEGYRLRCGAGTRLDLVRSALILSRSPLDFEGRADAPIAISSSDGSGQGLVVLDAGERSTLRHVRFEGLRSPDRPGWGLTGAVTFYRSPVEIADGAFASNAAEDTLNLVRSPFTVSDSVFLDASTDALDADFSDGSIESSSFRGAGKDAIEVSGARVELRAVRIETVGDRAVSAGEQAEVVLRDVEIHDASIAVASKDLGHVRADGLRVSASKVGFTAYQKKSEFGPGSMELRDTRLDAVGTPYLLEEGSKLVLSGRSLEPNASGLYARLYGSGSGG